jgi:oxygen-independent coproporphyrinogen-3 oxidase
MGFNRASFGVQDFDRAVQLAINASRPSRRRCALSTLPHVWLPPVNVDLIYGLLRQTWRIFTR